MSEEHPAPPPEITAEVFREWRSPRFGNTNPERMDNPLWDWLIRHRWDAYTANEALEGPPSLDAGPMWCFQRFGQSATALGDGVLVEIGGEHEDAYMPDFAIYNDLVVSTPDCIEVYGYPRAIFPPTDFHTATLTDSSIVLIGTLGYPEDRRPGETQVLTVQLQSWEVSAVQCTGDRPGWISRHRAELQGASAIKVSGGQLFRGKGLSLVENIDDWILHLEGWRWERLTQRRWPRFEAYRRDGQPHHLFWLRRALWDQQHPKWASREDLTRDLRSQLGGPPRLDVLDSLYRPPVPHECLPEAEDERHDVHRIRVEGVVVRYVEDSWKVQVTCEGELPSEVVDVLRQDLIAKLATLERSPIDSSEIP